MQFWPRTRSPRMTARIRSWGTLKDAKLLGFPGYKAGMTHIMYIENRPGTPAKGEESSMPVTVIECPPIRIIGIKTIKNDYNGLTTAQHGWTEKIDKNVSRALNLPATPKKVEFSTDGVVEVRVIAATQPHLANLKKTPEIVELGVGGNIEQGLEYAKKILGTDIKVADVFSAGQQVDAHSVTKGKGFQGPVKRHGVMIRSHKAEKTKRGPASLGPWGNARTYRVAHAGQTGFQRRTEYNKWVVKIDAKPEQVNPAGGFVRYGQLAADALLVKGSIGGSAKRLVTFTQPKRMHPRIPKTAPEITHISVVSKQ